MASYFSLMFGNFGAPILSANGIAKIEKPHLPLVSQTDYSASNSGHRLSLCQDAKIF